MTGNILEIRGLSISFETSGRRLPAVTGLDLDVAHGDVVGIVGESGSGKSLSMLAVMGLLPDNFHVSGSIRFAGEELVGKPERALRALRGRRMAMIFQDPMTALNPVLTVGSQIAEALRIHDPSLTRRQLRDRSIELLELVAIPMPARRFQQYPMELSGGMRQRVVIAIAMANAPELLIADEPTTALDVTIQAQIIDLLQKLREERRLSVLLITHDLGLVATLANKVTILYAGSTMERGTVDAIFEQARHPYTLGLIGATPEIEGDARLVAIDGLQPAIGSRGKGCPFQPRCPLAVPVCAERPAPVLDVAPGLATACHRASEHLSRERVADDL